MLQELRIGLYNCIMNSFFVILKFVIQCSVGFFCSSLPVSHNYICIPSLFSLPNPQPHPSHPTGHHRAQTGLSVLHCNLSPASHLTPSSVYMLILLCPCINSLPPTLSPQLHSQPLRFHSFPTKEVHQYHF